MTWYDYPDGNTANPVIFTSNVRESLVLDQTGEPFMLEEKKQVGFDLKKKKKGQ